MRQPLVSVCLVVALAWVARPQQVDSLTLEQILAKNLAARGTEEAFRAVKSMKTSGTLRLPSPNGPREFTFEMHAAEPSYFRIDININGNVITQAFDGTIAWQRNGASGAAETLVGAQKVSVEEQAIGAMFGSLVGAKAKGTTVEYLGREMAEGKNCYKLRATTRTGAFTDLFLDPDTFLEIAERIHQSSGSILEGTIEDYRRVGGLLFPHHFASHEQGKTEGQSLQIQKIELNPRVPAGFFSIPQS